jgi:steroid delta-isomerase-like uncharacterized protein
MGQSADVVRRWFAEVWREGGEETIDELLAPTIDGLMEGREIRSVSAFKEARRELLTAFPDLVVTVDDVIEDGNKVAVRWRLTGTHRGDGLGLPPTNKPISTRGITWAELENGQVVRGYDSWNLGALIAELSAAAHAKA